MTGVEGNLLINYAIIDEDFYSSSINLLVVLVTIAIFALLLWVSISIRKEYQRILEFLNLKF